MKKSTLALCVALALGNQAIASTSSSPSLADKAVCPGDISALSKEEKEKLPAICLAEEKSWLEENAPWLAAALGLTGSVIALHDMNHGSGHFSVLANPNPNPNPDDDNKDIIISLLPSVNTNIGHYLDLAGKPSNVIATGNTLVTNGATGVKIENAQGSGITTEGNIKVDGAGSVGLDVVGSGNIINQNGYNKVTNGATGNNITGDRNTVNTNERTEVHGSGSVGNHVTGSDNTVNQNGEQVVTSGGIGSLLDGQNNTVNIKGDTDVKGSDSVGSSIEGDKGKLKLDGDLNVSDGATGAHIKGEDGAVTVTGKVHVTDKDSVGINVTGNNASVITNGGITVKEEGTGIHVTGNNAQATGNGDIYVDGKGSTGIKLEGAGGKISHDGKLVVANGATGFDVKGDLADIATNLTVDVSDHDSLGIGISGNNGKFVNNGDMLVTHNATGANVSGTGNTVTLGGNVTVEKKPSKTNSPVMDGGQGIVVGGSHNTVNIDGKINLLHFGRVEPDANADVDGYLRGVTVQGDNNHVVLNGKITAIQKGYWSGPTSHLLHVSGNDNIVEVNGGINLDRESDKSSIGGILIDGRNTVNVSGKSQITYLTLDDGSEKYNGMSLFELSNSAALNLDKNSKIVISTPQKNIGGNVFEYIFASSGSTVSNKGEIIAEGDGFSGFVFGANDGSTINNSGVVSAVASGDWGGVFSGNGTFINDKNGVINFQNKKSNYIVDVLQKGNIVNQGTMNLTGFVSGLDPRESGSVLNEGVINLNGFVDGINPKDIALSVSGKWDSSLMSVAMRGGINTGTINVTDSGVGMRADGINRIVTNRGTIKLDLSADVNNSQDQLYGMVAINGGVAINDTDGKIIISTAAKDVAKPFYKDNNANSRIINMGQICIDDACETAEDYNKKPENSWVASGSQGGVLAETNQTLIIGDGGLLILPSETASSNAGTVKGGDLVLGVIPPEEHDEVRLENHGAIESSIFASNKSWVVNDGIISGNVTLDNAILNNKLNGNITGSVSVANGGVLHNSADISGAITVNNGNVYNYGSVENTGSRNPLVLKGTSFFSNHGEVVVGQLQFNSGNSVILNNKNAKLDFQTVSSMGGSLIYNEGTITFAKNNTFYGSNHGVINAGVIDIKNGTQWPLYFTGSRGYFWNKKGGEINSAQTGGAAVSIDSKDGIAINDGTITLTGKNTIAMQIYGNNDAKVINNGIINLGVSGGASTGLVGMDVRSGNNGVLENNGTININANNSYAFSKSGGNNARIINNGNVVIAAGVTGSGIIKQTGVADSIEGSAGKEHAPQTGKDSVHVEYTTPDELFIAPVLNLNASGKDSIATNDISLTALKSNVSDGATFINEKTGDIRFSQQLKVNGAGSVFLNKGTLGTTQALTDVNANEITNGASFINDGLMISRPNQDQRNLLVRTNAKGWNTENGVINTANNSGKAVLLNGANALFVNDGKINVTGNNGVAIYAESGSNTAVNNGTITLGEAGNPDAATGMVGMLLGANTAADSVMENNGTIQINANNSFAFSKEGNNGRIINNGIVSIADGVTGSGIIKQPGLADSIESGVNVDYTRPDMPTGKPGVNVIEGYTIGTTASGHAGKLSASNALLKDVTVNTGFAAGTADRTVTFDNVVTGKNIQGAENIRSESIVWNAQGKLNDKGNVDVTMTKNNYADVAGDGSVASVANALDKAYTNNALYNSLNLKTSGELSKALRQLSGSQATTAFNDARILSSRFDRLAAEAPEISNGLAFNAISRNDQRAELGNKVRYDMFALKQAFTLDESQTVELGYGIARLNGSGSSRAGDNGLTGGWSQFLSLKHRLSFGEDYSWSNSLRYDRHVLESNRLIRYGDVNKVASAQNRQQYMEYRTEGNKHIQLADGLNLTPSLGLKLRHTVNGNLNERGAGDFNLGLNSSMETAVDSVVGLKLDYTGKDGWSASAKLEGGPNLSYVKSQRTGVLQGAKGVRFNLDDGQKGGGLNGLAEVGMSYSKDNKSLSASAFQWKEDGIQDKGFMLNYNVRF